MKRFPVSVLLIVALCVTALSLGYIVFNTASSPLTIAPISQTAQVSASIPSGSVAYWSFDEGSGSSVSDSVGGNTLSFIGSPSWVPGRLDGKALSFAGTGQALRASSLSLNSSAVTISFWMNNASWPSSDTEVIEFSDNANTTTSGFGIYFNDTPSCSTGQFSVSIKGDVGYNAACFAAPGAGAWHHYAFVLDKSKTGSSEIKVYMDGSLQSTTKQLYSSDNTNTFSSKSFNVMTRAGEGSPTMSGVMEDLRVYARSLSSSEVNQIVDYEPIPADTTAPTISGISASSVTTTGASISWTTNEASDTQVEYGLTSSYGSNTSLNGTLSTSHSASLSGLQSGTVYHYRVISADAAGNEAQSSDMTFTTVAAVNQAPTASLTLSSTAVTAPGTVTLTATASDVDGTIAKVDFYNGPTRIYSDTTAPYSYTWSGIALGSYTVSALAYDNKGLSGVSPLKTFTVSNAPVVPNQPPTASLSLSASTVTAPGTVTLTATASDVDGTIAKVDFYNGPTRIYSDATAPYSYTWSGIALGSYTVSALAYDNKGLSGVSPLRTITVQTGTITDILAPTVPTNLTATAVSSSQINLSWTASVDAVGVTGYRIYRGGTEIATSVGTSYSNTGLTANTAYSYTVAAYDAAGNKSAQSAAKSATTQSGTSYTVTVSKSGTGTGLVTSAGSINCGSSCSSTGDPGMTVTLTAAPLAGSTFTGWSGPCTGTATTCTFTLNANTTVGAAFTAGVDTTAPGTPTNLTATAISSSQIDLAWTAPIDNVGVTGYRIYRGGTQIATSVGTSYSNTGLTANTAYSYTVAAYDAAANLSAQSAAKSATTLVGGGTTINVTPATWTNLAFVRGNTYVLAPGTYTSKTLDTPANGSQLITIKSSGTGQAIIPSLAINSSYWTIDGVTGAGFSVVPPDRNPANYGIQLTSANAITVGTNSPNGGVPPWNGGVPGISVTDITIKHIYAAVSLNDPIAAGSGFVFGMSNTNRNASVSNLTIGYSYFTGWGQALTMSYDNQWNNVTWEYNVYEEMFTSQTAGGPGGLHGNPINAQWASVNNLVVRYSLFYHTYGDGGLSQVIAANGAPITNAKIYGNVFDKTWSGRATISGNYHGLENPTRPTTSDDCVFSSVIYNNTFLRTATGDNRYDAGGLLGDECGSITTNVFKNNLAYDLRATFGPGISSSHNEYIYTRDTQSGVTDLVTTANSNPFTNLNVNDYTRKTNSAVQGTPLPSEYGYDATGRPRTTWTRGAFEYTGTTPPPASTGSILTKLVGSDFGTGTAPAGVVSKIDGGATTATNPVTTSSLSTTNHTVAVTDATGYNESYGTCTYPVGGTECTMPTSASYSTTGMTCTAGFCSVSVPVTSNTVTKVAFKYDVAVVGTYTITSTAGVNGTITPTGTVSSGASKTITITPNTGYQVANVLVDGASVGAVSTYTFTNVTANHTISATFSVVVAGTTYYVTPTGAGAKNGADWGNAYAGLPATLVRGATYYLSSGSYPYYVIDDAMNGTQVITIKKATTDSGQAIFSGIAITDTGYITIDGTYEYGIKSIGGDRSAAININGSATFTRPNITLKYVEMAGPGGASKYPFTGDTWAFKGYAGPGGADLGNPWRDITNLTISHSSLHGASTIYQATQVSGVIEYSKFYDSRCSSLFADCAAGPHPNVLFMEHSKNIIFRYNDISNWDAMGLYPAYSGSNYQIYGNVFHDAVSGSYNNAIYPHERAGDTFQNIYVYNNTFVNLGFRSVYIGSNSSLGGVVTGGEGANNLFFNSPGPTWGNLTNSNNSVVATSPFIGATDFRLKAATVAGKSLASPYNIDSIGSVRGADGTWDIGAYEYTGTTPPPTNVVPTVSLTSSATTGTAPATVTLTATASDTDGTISKVDFYNGAAFLSSDTTAPYTYIWTGMTAGTYAPTAKATDNGGASAVSSPVSIIITAPVTPPSTKFISGDQIQVSGTGSVINIRATASATGSIVGTKADGITGTVNTNASNGVYADGYYWWNVTLGGTTGWAVENYLAKYIPPVVTTGVWYVDNAATGSNNGTSWANAWKSFSAINWASVKAGHTVYISGGSSSKTYNETLNVGASGTAASPITISVSSDVGHSGKVIINGQSQSKDGIALASNIVINGNNGNNLRSLVLTNFLDTTNRYNARGIYGANLTGVKIKYVEVYTANNGIVVDYPDMSELSNVYVHDIRGDRGLSFSGSGIGAGQSGYGRNSIHDSEVQVNSNMNGAGDGPDGIQISSGTDVYGNKIYSGSGTIVVGQHQDGIQFIGENDRMYNNIITDMGNACMEGGSYKTTTGSYQIYNNICKVSTASVSGYQRGIEWSPNSSITSVTDVHIFNNNFIDLYGYYGIGFIWNGKSPSLSNFEIKNNIFHNTGSNPPAISIAAGSYSQANVSVDYNVMSAGTNGSSQISVAGSSYTQAHPSTSKPAFTSYSARSASNNFELLSSDTVAINKGVSMSTYATTDIKGVTRPQSTAWDIGAYEYAGTIVADTTAPSIPTGLTATAISTSQINLSWTSSTDNTGVAGYKIYRGGTLLATVTGTSYSNTGLTASTAYTYAVSAFDTSSNANESARSTSVTASTNAVVTTPPSIKFISGDRVQVFGTGTFLNVRATPSASGTVAGTQVDGTLGTIVTNASNGVYADGYYWWNVNFDSGADGWVVENYLVKSVVTPVNYTLTTTISGSGTISKTVGGTVTTATSFAAGTVVVMTASPSGTYTFSGWSGACSGSSTCTVTMNAATAVTASFIPATGAYRTFYIDYVSGSDANNGTSKATAWKRAPGMSGFAGAYSHQAGDHFLFKGGVTWPSATLPLIAKGSGTATNPDYYGVDTTWFAASCGASFCRPILDAEKTEVDFIRPMPTNDYITIDNFEMKNVYWNDATALYIWVGNRVGIVIKNCYFHSWSHGTAALDGMKIVTAESNAGSVGNMIENTIFDGDPNGTNPTGANSGMAVYNIPVIRNSIARNMSNGFLPGGIPSVPEEVSGSLIGPINMSFDKGQNGGTGQHENAIETAASPQLVRIFNNIIHDTVGVTVFLGPGVNYFYNNIIYRSSPIPLQLDARTGANTIYVYNNILDGTGTGSVISATVSATNPVKWGTADVKNNLFIAGSIASKNISTLIDQNNVSLTAAQAAAAGYTAANNYRGTVSPGTGANLTASAGTNMSALTKDILGTSRPSSGAWDVGAYDY